MIEFIVGTLWMAVDGIVKGGSSHLPGSMSYLYRLRKSGGQPQCPRSGQESLALGYLLANERRSGQQ